MVDDGFLDGEGSRLLGGSALLELLLDLVHAVQVRAAQSDGKSVLEDAPVVDEELAGLLVGSDMLLANLLPVLHVNEDAEAEHAKEDRDVEESGQLGKVVMNQVLLRLGVLRPSQLEGMDSQVDGGEE